MNDAEKLWKILEILFLVVALIIQIYGIYIIGFPFHKEKAAILLLLLFGFIQSITGAYNLLFNENFQISDKGDI